MIGAKLSNRYEVLRELGRGGMGVVYAAHDPLLGREVAVKVIAPAVLTPQAEERFRREARVVAKMDHPSIVTVHDAGSHEGSLYVVMPLVKGKSLRLHIEEGSLQLGEIIDIGIQSAEAIEYSHSNGIVHRDIKPENILIEQQESGGLRARVTDFGLAVEATSRRLTKTGAVVGTVAYLSPEQISPREVDGRTDIYSLGTVLYECLVGRTPFSGEVQVLLYRLAHELPQSPRLAGVDIDEKLEEIVLQCLEKDPARRYQKGADMAEALRRYRSRLLDSDSVKMMPTSTRITVLPHQRAPQIPLVGREKEFAEMQRRLNTALAGECQFVVLGGEPGVGKTRLLEELENLVRFRKIRVLHGRFVEQDQSFPYQGFCDAIQEGLRAKTTSSAPVDLSDLAPELVRLFPMLREVEDIRVSLTDQIRPAPSETHRIEDRTTIFEVLAGSLIRIAGGKPLVLFFEDLHSGEVSVEALQYVVRRLGPTPTLIIATYRTTEVAKRHPVIRLLDSFHGDRRFIHMRLDRLLPTEHRSYLEALIGSSDLEQAFVDRLYEATEGNPYFTKELVSSLIDSGRITKTETGSWSFSGETALSTEALPATIQETVQKRVERLPKNLRDTLSLASVVGKSFDLRDLAALAGKKERVEDAIEKLIAAKFLEEERGDRFTFASGVVRDVLYASLSRPKRKSHHRKYAEDLERRNTGRLERVYSQLLHHFSQGDVPRKTIEYGLLLAKRSLQAFSGEDAIRAAMTVLESLQAGDEENPQAEGEVRTLLAAGYRMTGKTDDALKELEEAVKLFRKGKCPQEEVSGMLIAAETAWESRRIEEAKRWVERGLAASRAEQDNRSLERFLSLAATLANLRGEHEKAKEYLDQAERLRVVKNEVVEELPVGGKLVVALTNSIQARHPAQGKIVEEQEVFRNVFETLLAVDEKGNIVPALCERWETLEKGMCFRLSLRQDVRMHDGGMLNAETVKACIESAVKLSPTVIPPAFMIISGLSEYLKQLTDHILGITIVSDHQLEIRLTESLAIYPALLTDPWTGLAKADRDDSVLLGTGPFQVESFEPSHIQLRRHQHYWAGTGLLDAVEFRAGLNAAEIAKGFRTGDLDLVRDLLPADLEEILRDKRLAANFVEVPKKNIYFVLFNSSSLLGQNVLLRQALCGVVRTHDLVRGTLGRLAQPAEGLFPPGILGHDPGSRRQVIPQEKAVEFLQASGVSRSTIITASVHPILRDRYVALTQALFDTWSNIGISVTIKTDSMASFLESEENSLGFDLIIGRWTPDYDDPDSFTYSVFNSKVGVFRRFYSSEDLDKLMEQARSEAEPTMRGKIYRKIEDHLTDSGLLLPLFHEIDYRVASPKVKGLALRSAAPYVNYAELGKVEAVAPAIVRKTGGGILHVPLVGLIHSLDPSSTFTIMQHEVIATIFENLTRVTEEARVVGWLASEYSAAEDGRSFRFRLREDLRFQDGRRVTSRDVRYSLEHLLANEVSSQRWLLAPIAGAEEVIHGRQKELAGFEILSASEFVIRLNQPISFFPSILTYTTIAIIPEGTAEFRAGWQKGCLGTGPYRVVNFEPGRRLELEPNPYYWLRGLPKNDGLVFHLGVSPSEILAGFREGRFSLASDLFPPDVETLRRVPEFASSYREKPRLSTYFLLFNTHSEALSDLRIRQRLVESIDVATLVRQTIGRLAIPAYHLTPPGLLGYSGAVHLETAPGKKPEHHEEITLTGLIHSIFEGPYSDFAQALFKCLRESGFRIHLMETMADSLQAHKVTSCDFVLTRWFPDYPDADAYVHSLLHSTKGLYGRFCGVEETDLLAEKARAETDPEVRQNLYRVIEGIIRQQALVLPLFHELAYRFARPEVSDFDISFFTPTVPYEQLSLRR